MVMNVNVFCMCMIATITCQCNSGLIVTVECRWTRERLKHFTNESMKPECFFGGVHSSDILRFSCRECNELLLLQSPENCSLVNEESEACNCASMLLCSTIRIDVLTKPFICIPKVSTSILVPERYL